MVCTQYEVPAQVLNVSLVYLCRHDLKIVRKHHKLPTIDLCTYCNTLITKLSNHSDVPRSITMQATRYLGRGRMAFQQLR